VDSHIGCAMSGLTADARTLIDHGRVEAQVLSCDHRHSVSLRATARAWAYRPGCPETDACRQQTSRVLHINDYEEPNQVAIRLQPWTKVGKCVRCSPDPVSCVAQQHRFTYNEPMPVESCTQSLCDLALRFGEDDGDGGMVSPAGLLTLASP